MTDQTDNMFAPASRCHWFRDGDYEILIPMCMGTATNGLEGCTCDVPESRIEAVERDALQARVGELEAAIKRQAGASKTLLAVYKMRR
jgi:hypothetical protein